MSSLPGPVLDNTARIERGEDADEGKTSEVERKKQRYKAAAFWGGGV